MARRADRMTWSTLPDLKRRRQLVLAALAASIASAAVIAILTFHDYQRGLGDTDDAVRLMLVREFLQGRGWYHPEIARLQAPWGAVMHWSRLIDGGIAGLESILRLLMPAGQAETATRFIWPLLWLFPAILPVVAIARRLGGSAAMICCAMLVPMSLALFTQFGLGRVDHHNIQETMSLIAIAAAITGRDRWQAGALAGLASALGLAVGYEALVFHALIGVFFALSLLTRAEMARPARAYGLALASGGAGFFLIETPPHLWGVAVCDTVGANLVAALVLSGLGLAAASGVTHRKVIRGLMVLGAGMAAVGAYVAANPSCLHGPMGEVGPQITDYINHISEMLPLWRYWMINGPWTAGMVAGPAVAVLVLPLLLRRNERWKDPNWLLMSVSLAVAFALMMLHVRMQPYANWLAVPVLGCLVADLAPLWRRYLVATIAAAALVSPTSVTLAVVGVEMIAWPAQAKIKAAEMSDPSDHCSESAAYAGLARMPAGLVLNEIDLGPFIVAYTPHSAMSGPYHRFSRGLTNTFRAFSEPADRARDDLKSLNVTYVVICPKHADRYDRAMAGPWGLLTALDARKAPTWLEPLSPPGATLMIYRVK